MSDYEYTEALITRYTVLQYPGEDGMMLPARRLSGLIVSSDSGI
jgi:hypothetical protein